MTSQIEPTPRYWRARAEEVRTIAETMIDPWCRSKLEGVADTYDTMAQRAEWREQADRTQARKVAAE